MGAGAITAVGIDVSKYKSTVSAISAFSLCRIRCCPGKKLSPPDLYATRTEHSTGNGTIGLQSKSRLKE